MLRPQLLVLAPSMVEAVRFAGGWLFDRVMAGWDVTVLTATPADYRPLRILGARAVDLDSALAPPVIGPRHQAIAVDAGLYDSDTRVRQIVLDAINDGVADVRLWGARNPVDRDGGARAVQHRLSMAARAFKAQALAAAAAPADPIDVTEMFRTREPSGEPDLVPAA